MPHPIGVRGYPSHLLRLSDSRLLMSYGHRWLPLGIQARLSLDQGQTWSEAMTISADGTSSDLGYPSTVELGDGSLLTVWYEQMGSSANEDLAKYNAGYDEAFYSMMAKLPPPVVRQARWSIRS